MHLIAHRGARISASRRGSCCQGSFLVESLWPGWVVFRTRLPPLDALRLRHASCSHALTPSSLTWGLPRLAGFIGRRVPSSGGLFTRSSKRPTSKLSQGLTVSSLLASWRETPPLLSHAPPWGGPNMRARGQFSVSSRCDRIEPSRTRPSMGYPSQIQIL